jgi:mRNA guanylyltransferase
VDRRNICYYVNGLRFPCVERFDERGRPIGFSLDRFHKDTLLDGEIVLDVFPDGSSQPKFLVFDALAVDKKNLLDHSLDKRLGVHRLSMFLTPQHFMQFILEPYKALLKTYPEAFPEVPFV